MYAKVEVVEELVMAFAGESYFMNGGLLAGENANASPPVKIESRANTETFIL